MSQPTRFTVKRDGADGALVRDNQTGRTVAVFPPDPELPGMARRFAEAAADEFNRRHVAHLADRRRRGW